MKFTWIQENLFELIRKGGKLVSDEVYNERVKACKKCPHIGIVHPLPGIEAEGCTLCQCPLETKAQMLEYFSPTHMGMKLSECSLVEKTGEDRWTDANALIQKQK